MRIHGRVTVEGDLVLEGSFAGALVVNGSFTLAAGAQCQASVQARTADVHGALTGALTCSERIAVGPGARVLGDLSAPRVDVDPTSEVVGEVIRAPGRGDVSTGARPSRLPAAARRPGPTPVPTINSVPRGRTTVELRGPAPQRPVPPGDAAQRAARLFVNVRRPDDRPVPRPPRLRGRVAMVRRSAARVDGAGATT